MSYQRRILSDSTPINIGTSATITVSGDYSDSLDIRNYNNVDFFIKIGSKSSATSLSITVEYSSIAATSDEDWSDLKTENISSGAATQSTYSADFDLSGESGIFTLSLNIPTRGRYMRIKATPDSSISTVTFTAIRKI